jgi:hypothetical protein
VLGWLQTPEELPRPTTPFIYTGLVCSQLSSVSYSITNTSASKVEGIWPKNPFVTFIVPPIKNYSPLPRYPAITGPSPTSAALGKDGFTLIG